MCGITSTLLGNEMQQPVASRFTSLAESFYQPEHAGNINLRAFK